MSVGTREIAGAVSARGARLRRHGLFESGFPYLLILPAVAGVLLVILFPIFYNTWLSFHLRRLIIPQTPFVGMANYQRVLQDPEFWNAVWVTAVWAVGSIGLNFLVGLGMALMLDLPFPGGAEGGGKGHVCLPPERREQRVAVAEVAVGRGMTHAKAPGNTAKRKPLHTELAQLGGRGLHHRGAKGRVVVGRFLLPHAANVSESC